MTTQIPDDEFEEGNKPLSRARPDGRHRAPVREPQREVSARESDTRLKRSRKRSEDRFYVDPRIIPEGVSYEWKRESVYGKDDPAHMNSLRDNHWQPVPKDRHPGLVVEQDGMVLMERPSYLTQEARQEDFDIARDQVRSVNQKLQDVPEGQFDRRHPSARRATRLNSEHSLAIPEE